MMSRFFIRTSLLVCRPWAGSPSTCRFTSKTTIWRPCGPRSNNRSCVQRPSVQHSSNSMRLSYCSMGTISRCEWGERASWRCIRCGRIIWLSTITCGGWTRENNGWILFVRQRLTPELSPSFTKINVSAAGWPGYNTGQLSPRWQAKSTNGMALLTPPQPGYLLAPDTPCNKLAWLLLKGTAWWRISSFPRSRVTIYLATKLLMAWA